MHMISNIESCANVYLKVWYSTVEKTSINGHIALVFNNRDNEVMDVFDQVAFSILK